MPGLTQSIQQQTKWIILLSVAVGGLGLRGCYLEKRTNYRGLWEKVGSHERRIAKLELSENHIETLAEGMIFCSGGFTDKNNITWDWKCPGQESCRIEDCCYTKRYCKECISSISLEEPPNEEKCQNRT